MICVTDRQEIRNLLERYFYALDSRNLELLGDCFTPDATISLLGNVRRMDGPETIVAAFRAIGEYKASSHFVTSQHATIADEDAQAHTLAIAVLVQHGDSPVLVRGIEYRDELSRTPAGWRIARRIHDALWQFDTEQTAPFVPHV